MDSILEEIEVKGETFECPQCGDDSPKATSLNNRFFGCPECQYIFLITDTLHYHDKWFYKIRYLTDKELVEMFDTPEAMVPQKIKPFDFTKWLEN